VQANRQSRLATWAVAAETGEVKSAKTSLYTGRNQWATTWKRNDENGCARDEMTELDMRRKTGDWRRLNPGGGSLA